MLKSILVFRTDRIGDLLINYPTIITIKKYFKNSEVTLVTSKKNMDYAKSFNIFESIYNFPEGDLIKKIKFIKMLRKKFFDYIFVFDGKDRSAISSIFLKSSCKVALMKSKKFNLIFNLTKIKQINNDEKKSIPMLYQEMLDKSNIKMKISDYNFLLNKENNNFSSNINIKNYILLHLDEKWISGMYINKYKDIDPGYNEFIEFINNISAWENLVITTGIINFKLIDDLKEKYFIKVNNKIYEKNNGEKKIYLVLKPTFQDLESLLRTAKILISCHGAITHAAGSLHVKILDIIDENSKNWYQRYTSHIKNYNFIFRNKFSEIKKIIPKKINL